MSPFAILLGTMAYWLCTTCDQLVRESSYDEETYEAPIRNRSSKKDYDWYHENPYAQRVIDGRRNIERVEEPIMDFEDTIEETIVIYPYKTRLNAVEKTMNITNDDVMQHLKHFKDFIASSDSFVDKSLLLKEIIESKKKLIIITTPPRWGKSLNLDMIKTFFEIEVDRNGDEFIPKKKTFNFGLFGKGLVQIRGRVYKMRKPFLIAQYPEIINVHLGHNPVIHLNLGNISGITYEDVFNACKRRIARTFARHSYMIGVLRDNNDPNDIKDTVREKLWRQFCKYSMNGQIPELQLEESLQFLTKILYDHFGRRVYVLIDDFDVPVTQMLQGSYFKIRDEQKLCKFYESLIRFTIMGNPYIEKCILAGNLRLGGRQHPYLNTSGLHEFLNNSLSEYFGFNEREVQSIFRYYEIPAELADQVYRWYGGFRTYDTNESMYQPLSIMRFVYNKKFAPFWQKPAENLYLTNVLQVRPIRGMVESLVVANNISVYFSDSVHTDSIIRLKMITNGENIETLDHTAVNLQLSYLISLGYLTYEILHYNHTRSASYVQVRIPNQAIREEFIVRLRIYYNRHDGIRHKDMDIVARSLCRFIMSPNATSVDFIATLWNFYEDLAIFVQTTSRFRLYITNGLLLQSIRNYLTIIMYHQYGYEVIIQRKIATSPDMVFIKNGTAAILKLHYNSRSAEYAVSEAKTYLYHIQHRTDVTRVKYIGIAITLSKDVYVDSETVSLPARHL